ncbi:MAG: phage holin family protein [Lachnospiraceae bacterium]|nr:phage holin family protein [Lachnospiraceae bacterium]
MELGIASVAAITAISYLVGMGCKASARVKDEVIPVIVGGAGLVLGVAAMFVMPDFPANDVINAAAIGVVSGLASTGIDQIKKQYNK